MFLIFFVILLISSSTVSEQKNGNLNIIRSQEIASRDHFRPIPQKPKKKTCEKFLNERRNRIMNSGVKRKLDFDLLNLDSIAGSPNTIKRTLPETTSLEEDFRKRAKTENEN